MDSRRLIPLVPLVLVLCGCGGLAGGPGGNAKGPKKEDLPVPVRTALPTRGTVEEEVQTQATLESDLRADVTAEIEGKIEERLRDVGDAVGREGDGPDAFLLARLDHRQLDLAAEEAAVRLRDRKGRIEELELERQRTQRELESARVTLAEAESVFARTSSGIRDGTISREEHERATFGRSLADSKVKTAEAARQKAEVALSLGAIAVEEQQIAVDRAEYERGKAMLRSPVPGVVTLCNVRVGERVRVGDLLYRVEDPASLVLYANIPVRQAKRVKVGNPVLVGSSAAPDVTTGTLLVVAPTVDKESGTVRCKIGVVPAPGFKPGLFVTVRIVVEKREGALIVPKRAVLHDDQQGAYLFVVADGAAARKPVTTGFERDDAIEIVEGLAETSVVVVEGQDTLTSGAKVEIRTS